MLQKTQRLSPKWCPNKGPFVGEGRRAGSIRKQMRPSTSDYTNIVGSFQRKKTRRPESVKGLVHPGPLLVRDGEEDAVETDETKQPFKKSAKFKPEPP